MPISSSSTTPNYKVPPHPLSPENTLSILLPAGSSISDREATRAGTVLTVIPAGPSDLESAAEFAQLLSESHTRWAGRPDSRESRAGRMPRHRPLGYCQAPSAPSSPFPTTCASPREPVASGPRGHLWLRDGGVSCGPGMGWRHPRSRGKQGSPVSQGPGAAAREARRRPHARPPPPLRARGCASRVQTILGVTGREDGGHAHLTGGVSVRCWPGIGNPSPKAPSPHPGRPRAARPLLPASGAYPAREWGPQQTRSPERRRCGRNQPSGSSRRRSGSGPQIRARPRRAEAGGGGRSPGRRAKAPPPAEARGGPCGRGARPAGPDCSHLVHGARRGAGGTATET